MNTLEWAATRLIPFLPAGIAISLATRRALAMTNVIDGLSFKSADVVTDMEEPLAIAELANGTTLFGQMPTRSELAWFGPVAAKQGLTRSHAKLLIDIAARYVYPHMAVGYMEMSWAAADRAFCHPQHRNLAQEDPVFTASQKEALRRVFTPQKAWVVLDIGAYLGHGAVRMSQQIGSGGTIVAVEGLDFNARVIAQHADVNGITNLKVKQAAIYSVAGQTVTLTTTNRQANAIDQEVVKGTRSVEVITTSIAELARELGTAPNLVSLTVNGAEVEAIEGMDEMRAEERPERILAPGWYLRNGKPRWKIIGPKLRDQGYKVAVTRGGFVFGWRV